MMLEDIFPVTIIQIRCCGSKLDYLHLLNTDVSVSLLACCSRFTVCSSLRSDAQTLHTSMPIAWIPGRYGNRYVAHTDLHPLITLVAMVTCFQWELECCRGRPFLSFRRTRRTDERDQILTAAESTNQTTHSRPASTSSTQRPPSPPPASVSPRPFKPVLLKVCLPWQCCLWQVLMSCVCVCSGGDEGGGDREMPQRHQEAPRGDGVQKQQVTATHTESARCHRPDSHWHCSCFYANSG